MALRFLTPEPSNETTTQFISREDRLKAAMTKSTIHGVNSVVVGAAEIPTANNDKVASRLDALRAALKNHEGEEENLATTKSAEEPSSEESILSEPEEVTNVVEEAPEPVLETEEPEVKASFQQYSGLNGIDINNLPKDIPEARGIFSMSAKYEIQDNLKKEMNIWRARRENIQWASAMLSSKEDTDDWTKEYFNSLVAANENNIGKINAKAEGLVEDANKKIAALGETPTVNQSEIQVFSTLAQIRSERFTFPVYKGSDGYVLANSLSLADNNKRKNVDALTSAIRAKAA